MTRPCFLVVDREFAGSISSRKLLIETAKFNVITAYSGSEAIELFDRFPGMRLAVPLGELEPQGTFIMNGHLTLPVHLTAQPVLVASSASPRTASVG